MQPHMFIKLAKSWKLRAALALLKTKGVGQQAADLSRKAVDVVRLQAPLIKRRILPAVSAVADKARQLGNKIVPVTKDIGLRIAQQALALSAGFLPLQISSPVSALQIAKLRTLYGYPIADDGSVSVRGIRLYALNGNKLLAAKDLALAFKARMQYAKKLGRPFPAVEGYIPTVMLLHNPSAFYQAKNGYISWPEYARALAWLNDMTRFNSRAYTKPSTSTRPKDIASLFYVPLSGINAQRTLMHLGAHVATPVNMGFVSTILPSLLTAKRRSGLLYKFLHGVLAYSPWKLYNDYGSMRKGYVGGDLRKWTYWHLRKLSGTKPGHYMDLMVLFPAYTFAQKQLFNWMANKGVTDPNKFKLINNYLAWRQMANKLMGANIPDLTDPAQVANAKLNSGDVLQKLQQLNDYHGGTLTSTPFRALQSDALYFGFQDTINGIQLLVDDYNRAGTPTLKQLKWLDLQRYLRAFDAQLRQAKNDKRPTIQQGLNMRITASVTPYRFIKRAAIADLL